MINKLTIPALEFQGKDFLSYRKELWQSPLQLLAVILDIAIVIYLVVKFLKVARETRAWQLLKGILLLIIVTLLSEVFNFRILNWILTSFMTYGVILLIVIFQPELRRALEQLRNK